MTTKDGPSLRLSVPALSGRLSSELVESTVARLIASREADTQVDLVRVTGLSRTTVSAALESLSRSGVVRHVGMRKVAGRGRPADRFGLDPSFGKILVADIGVTSAHLSVHDLGQVSLADRTVAVSIADGPDVVLDRVQAEFEGLLAELGAQHEALALVIGLPGPVDNRRGVPVKPPIMPGWDGHPVADRLSRALDCPVLVENDVNMRALGEARALSPDQSPLLYIKMSTGIGGGLVTASGDLHLGADGAAGDIGHVRVPGAGDVLCACGNQGCVEAVASAGAVLRQLHHLQRDGGDGVITTKTVDDLIAALRGADAMTTSLVKEAGARVGEVVAMLVHFFNPARIVVGGSLASASDDVLAGIRAVVYHRALPLATRNLVINPPVLGDRSGTAGGVVLGVEHVLTEDALAQAMARRAAAAGAAR